MSDAALVRLFFHANNQCTREVVGRAKLISGEYVLSLEASKQVQLNYCVKAKWLKLLIDHGFISEVSSHDKLSNNELRTFLAKKAEESKDVVIIEALDNMEEAQLRSDTTNKDARSRIESLFVSYQSLPCRNGLSWLKKSK